MQSLNGLRSVEVGILWQRAISVSNLLNLISREKQVNEYLGGTLSSDAVRENNT